MSKLLSFGIILLNISIIFMSCQDSKNKGFIASGDPKTDSMRVDSIKNLEIRKKLLKQREEAYNLVSMMLNKSKEMPEELVKDYFLVDYIVNNDNLQDIIDLGEWYQLNKDNTFEHGFLNKTAEKGKYAYGKRSKSILLYYDSENEFPEEWKILLFDNELIFEGTTSFGTEKIKKHLRRVKERPVLK
jgi:hypothetical protein